MARLKSNGRHPVAASVPAGVGAPGTVQIVCAPSRSGKGPDTAGSRTPGSTCTSKISSTPALNSRWATCRPVVRSTTPTPHRRLSRRSAIGTPPKVDVSRIFDSPTNAYDP